MPSTARSALQSRFNAITEDSRLCAGCGEHFVPERKNQFYCSKGCGTKARNKRMKAKCRAKYWRKNLCFRILIQPRIIGMAALRIGPGEFPGKAPVRSPGLGIKRVIAGFAIFRLPVRYWFWGLFFIFRHFHHSLNADSHIA
jgi:hypothetical protein